MRRPTLFLAIALAIALSLPATSAADNRSTVGGVSTSSDSSNACRGAKFRADRDGTLLGIDIDAHSSAREALVFDVWESINDTGGYARITSARRSKVGTQQANVWGWEASGPLAAPLVAGRHYVALACWPGSSVAFRYGSAAQEALPVGQFLGGVEAWPGGPDSGVSFGTTAGFSMRLHTSAGDPLDVDAEFGAEGPFVEAFAGGAAYRVDSPSVLLGFRQLVRLEADADLDWYVARCQGASQSDCPDGSPLWDTVASGTQSANADPYNPDRWVAVDDLQVALELGWIYAVGLGWDDALSTGYHRIIDTDIHPAWGETLGLVSTTDPLPLASTASFAWSASYEMPQQLITADDSADAEETLAFTGVSGFWKMGNIFSVDTPTRIEQLGFNLYTGYSGQIRMAIYQGSTEQGSYTLLWERDLEIPAGSALAWAESGPVELDIGPDPATGAARHYLFAVGFEGNGVHARASAPPDQPVSFGARVHGWYAYTGSAAFPSTVNSDFVDRYYGWRIESCAACVDGDGDGWEATDDCDDADPAVSPSASEQCNGLDDDCDGDVDEGWDVDGDGATSCGGDCDDGNAAIAPSAPELCDAVDQDCDGLVDEDFDGDGDGFVDPLGAGCVDGWSPGALDCDDAAADAYPGAPELCDGIDNDCDGDLDEVSDEDGDGYGPCNGDCDDTDFFVHPAAAEVCDGRDNDCSGSPGDGSGGDPDELDLDGDGWLVCLPDPFDPWGDGVQGGGDCADSAPDRHPAALEICDGLDNDCDGAADGPFDADGDGYPSAALCPTLGTDCDDNDPARNPGAVELCNGLDDDCDGVVPTGAQDEVDDDGDGASECEGDCDDLDPASSPLAIEACDGADNDCDGLADEDFDLDQDGYFAQIPCPDGDDCDDGDPLVHPGAVELCDAADNDCNGGIDEPYDFDGDGYVTGDLGACEAAWGPAVDCDDFDPDVSPGADELCNGVDDDCNGGADEDFDQDGDGWVDADAEGCADAWEILDCDDADADVFPYNLEDCANGLDDNCDGQINENTDDDADGITTCNGDCDDDDPAILPGAAEVCDGRDNDCDLQIDEFFDVDGDGFLDASLCGDLPGATDCDDADPAVHPGRPELCDGLDQDCDGQLDEAFDGDGDGAVDGDAPGCLEAWGDAVDCNDLNADVAPGAQELCNARDDDCDGQVDEGWDADGDGAWADSPGCAATYGLGLDCDDTDASVGPDAPELCDGLDNDCDGSLAEDADHDGWFDGDDEGCVDAFPGEDLDCDDDDPEVHPDAAEVCDDGVDNECDGQVDDADASCEPDRDDPPVALPSHQADGLAAPTIVGACADCSSDFSGGGFGLLSLLVLIGRRRRA